MPNVPYPYAVKWQMVTCKGFLTPICSLSPSLIVLVKSVNDENLDASLKGSWPYFDK